MQPNFGKLQKKETNKNLSLKSMLLFAGERRRGNIQSNTDRRKHDNTIKRAST